MKTLWLLALTAGVIAVVQAAAISTNCIPQQECKNLLQGATSGGGLSLSISALYSAAFSVFGGEPIIRSVQTLIGEFNDPSTIQCGRNFSEFNETTLQITQSDGPGVFDYFFPGARSQGQPRTLENSRVDVTLPQLGTYGDLRLRYLFNANGDAATLERFIRPPNQATDAFYPFPLLQTVSAPWLGIPVSGFCNMYNHVCMYV